MDKFYIITNEEKDIGLTITQSVCAYLRTHDKTCYWGEVSVPADTDCILVLGGDGTLIRAARELGADNIPLLGINLGTLGFLTALEQEEVHSGLDCLIRGEYSLESRMMIAGRVISHDGDIQEDIALNDIIVTSSGFSRLVEVKLYINDQLAEIYVGDGIIVATPTGSTAYNLSAGGPVVFPETELMVITPICPHSMAARSIVVSARDRIAIEVGRRRKDQVEGALVTFDGQQAFELKTEDRVEITKAKENVRLVKVNQKGFYEILRSKIRN